VARPKVVYWEMSMFVAMLKGETCHGATFQDAVREQMRAVESRQLVIVTSDIIYVELFPSRYPPDQWERFEGWMQHECVQIQAVERSIARKAGGLRERCQDLRPEVRVTAIDAIHAATALHLGVAEFHATDLRLNRVFEHLGETLRASVPDVPQLTMTARFESASPTDEETEDDLARDE
jgi:predicted nucleic acid-binding protein